MKNEIERILEEETRGTHLYILELEVKNNRIDVFVDGDAGVNIAECAQLNRQLHRRLEDLGIDTGEYLVDVSSPGIDRPIEGLRAFKKNVGRKLEVTKQDGKALTGLLVLADGEKIILKAGTGIKAKKEVIYYKDIAEAISTI
jgi:ribosome maturation factor RimP